MTAGPVEVVRLTRELEPAYEDLLSQVPHHLIYGALKYRAFLLRILDGARDCYLVAMQDGRLVGALPCFILESQGEKVINSLPFYGSHGGPLVSPDAHSGTVRCLLGGLADLAAEEDALSCTLIENPLDPLADDVVSAFPHTVEDVRVGQLTSLPAGDRDTVERSLMDSFHYKTRNMVRKGGRQPFQILRDESVNGLRRLHEIHVENMRAIGGKAKPWSVFEQLAEVYHPGTEFRLYQARDGDRVVSAVLLLYHAGTVEYYAPVVDQEYRSSQVLSAIIFKAMIEASLEGYRLWNWGGTWTSQDGVYRFKSRWGAVDRHYRYLVRVAEERLNRYRRDELERAFPFFYVVPYDCLMTASRPG